MSFALSCLCPSCTLVQVVNQARHDPTRYAPAMHLPAISPLSPRYLPAISPRPLGRARPMFRPIANPSPSPPIHKESTSTRYHPR